MSKSVVRSVKNVTKGYSHVQVKVRNATSNDPWGPTGTEMQEIAQLTYNSSGDFYEIMDMLDKRMNDKGKNWRHVLKSLKVLDYCLHEGSELVVTWARKNIFLIKTLREFQHIDEDGRDVGQNVRVSAKELTALILDEDRLRAERRDRKSWKSRVTGLEDFGPTPGYEGGSDRPPPQQRQRRQRPQKEDESDLEYRLALEASKNEVEEDRKRREQQNQTAAEDDDLAKALKLSREEEELRKRELEDTNAQLLFDDTPAQSQPTGYNQGYQQQGAVDWAGNPVEQQQPQSTGYLNNLYGQPTGIQNQQAGFQNGYGYNNNPYQQPQQTGFDQSQYQQQQQQPQQSYLQPQQTAFNMNNPYSQQPNSFGAQNQQQQQQQDSLQPGSQNPWSSNNNNSDNIKPQPTGSNNPFSSAPPRPQQTQSAQRPPTLSTLQEQRTQNQYTSPFSSNTSFSAQPQPSPQKEQDPHHANLNALLSSGDGQDTFGNTGNLRIPAQHTAPGHFVNSAGSHLNQLNPSITGSNPFVHNQFTGAPQQAPAQTGPASGFGGSPFGSGNPFGSQRPGQGQGQQQQQGGSLIDL